MEQSSTWRKYSKREFPLEDGYIPDIIFPKESPGHKSYRIITRNRICSATPLYDSGNDPMGLHWKTKKGLISHMMVFGWEEDTNRQPLLPSFQHLQN